MTLTPRSASGILRQLPPSVGLFISSTGSLMIGLLAQALALIVLAHYIGPVQFGQFMTITAVTNLAGTWTGFGPGEVMRRLVGRDRLAYREVMGHCLILIFGTGIILTISVIACMILFVPIIPDTSEYFFILLYLVPSNVLLSSLVSQAEYVFLAHDDFRNANLVNSCFGVARALSAVVPCIVFGVVSLRGFAAWWCVVHSICCLICGSAIWRFGVPKWRILWNELWLGGNLALSSFLIMLRHNIDILVLNVVATPQFVGAYGAGRRIIGAALVAAGSFDRIIYGKLAAAGKGGPSATLSLAKRYLPYAVLISSMTSVALFVTARYMPLIFGVGFAQASDVVKVLCWTLISTAVQFIAFDALNAAQHHRVSTVVSGLANVAGAAMVVGLGDMYQTAGIYTALYLSDFIRGAGLWLALILLSRWQNAAKGKIP